jgi:hypothetical protein
MRRAVLIFVCCLTVLFTGLILYGHTEAASGRGKAVSGNLLPNELKNLSIKDDFIPYTGKEAGEIRTIVGHVVVARENMRQAYFAAAGDKLYEKDVVFTLKKSRCRFKLHNEDTVTLGENARVGITAFADDRKTKEKRSAFDMARGKAMFFTLRLFKHKGASMTVSTPTAVAGVRGTKFGVEVIELAGTPSAALPVLVADASNAGFRHLAQATPPPPLETNVYTFEGVVDVTSVMTGETKTLQQGQGMSAVAGGLGNAFQTPSSTSQQFEDDTNVGTPAVIGLGTEGGATGENPPNTGVGDTSGLSQNLNTPQATGRPTRHEGYFVGMLTRATSVGYATTYMSETLQNFDSSEAKAFVSDSTTQHVRIDGTGGSDKKVVEVVYNTYTASGLPQPMQRTELGYNAYMEWGSWTQPNTMNIGGTNYIFDNKGYYVWGDVTADAQMAALRANDLSATYSGIAHGTVWSGTGGIDQSGTFSMNVNFSPSTDNISSFQVWVGSVGNTTGMSGGTGTITGSSFSVTSTNVYVNGSAGSSGSANGAFYGPNAEQAGGVWNVNGSGGYANGMFQGTKGPPLGGPY